ncbi:hypothetical protein [Vibrio rarus]|uniref:hypothetical protein n=1 Tax=Vibrio rarus TaxID=413403 RepID=UPI0021C26FE9|nr:hypothetical protein [Vibrio rarus]
MFMVIATSLCALAVLLLCLHYGKQSQANINRYHLICELRSVTQHLREHRHLVHTHLSYGGVAHSHISDLESNISESLQDLVHRSFINDRPMFRLLTKQVHTLMQQWPTMTPSKSQMSHGRAIRASLYLIDEIVLTWLIETEQVEESDTYSRQWSYVIDSLEALTQFRMLLDDSSQKLSTTGQNELLLVKAQYLLQKIKRLNRVSPLTTATLTLAQTDLSEIISAQKKINQLPPRQLYQLTNEISLAIFKVYDQILVELCEKLYHLEPCIEAQA